MAMRVFCALTSHKIYDRLTHHLILDTTPVPRQGSNDVQAIFFGLVPKVGSKQSAPPILPTANLSRTSQLGKESSLFNPIRQLILDTTLVFVCL